MPALGFVEGRRRNTIMIKITDFIISKVDDVGCTNGNYNGVQIKFDSGDTIEGKICRCGNGCSKTLCLHGLYIGFEVNSINDILVIVDAAWAKINGDWYLQNSTDPFPRCCWAQSYREDLH